MSQFIEKTKSAISDHLQRFFRFGIVGGIGVIVNFGLYTLLHDVVGIYDMIAVVIAVELSILNNFILNERWTFRDRAGRNFKVWLQRCLGFHLSSGLVALVVQPTTLFILTRYFDMWDKAALAIGILLGALANYFICTKLIFRTSKTEEA